MAKDAVQCAIDKWGRGWALLSGPQQAAEVSDQVVLALLKQEDVSPEVRSWQMIAKNALKEVAWS